MRFLYLHSLCLSNENFLKQRLSLGHLQAELEDYSDQTAVATDGCIAFELFLLLSDSYCSTGVVCCSQTRIRSNQLSDIHYAA